MNVSVLKVISQAKMNFYVASIVLIMLFFAKNVLKTKNESFGGIEMKKLSNEVLNGQVSIFDLMGLTTITAAKKVIKRVIFKPKYRWQSNFFNEFKADKEYDVVDEYKNRCGVEFYVIAGIERNAWCELFTNIME